MPLLCEGPLSAPLGVRFGLPLIPYDALVSLPLLAHYRHSSALGVKNYFTKVLDGMLKGV